MTRLILSSARVQIVHLLTVFALITGVHCHTASAEVQPLAQMDHAMWTARDGAPQGVLALTQALADEGKTDDIKAVAICPALVATPMTEVSGPDYLQPEDVAETVLYLLRLSPAAWPTEIVLERKGAD